jgi:hypothetical protein
MVFRTKRMARTITRVQPKTDEVFDHRNDIDLLYSYGREQPKPAKNRFGKELSKEKGSGMCGAAFGAALGCGHSSDGVVKTETAATKAQNVISMNSKRHQESESRSLPNLQSGNFH